MINKRDDRLTICYFRGVMNDEVEKALKLIKRGNAVRMPICYPCDNISLREGRRIMAIAESGLLYGSKRVLARQRAEQLMRCGEEHLMRERELWRRRFEGELSEVVTKLSNKRFAELKAAMEEEASRQKRRDVIRMWFVAVVCLVVGCGIGYVVCGLCGGFADFRLRSNGATPRQESLLLR